MIYGVVGIAAALSATDAAPDAAMLLGAADSAARATAVELEPIELEVHEQVTEKVEHALGAERFAEIHASGRALSLDDAVERGLRAAESRQTATSKPEPRATS
jgi:hypothetical protein